MNKSDKTNVSQALFLAQPASDDSVTNSDQDELSALPAEFGGMYRACYETGYASGKEAGYRQGYQAGFWDGRGQSDAGSTAAPAAVENTAPGMRKARLFGLPCNKCGNWFFSDEACCPRCQTPRVGTAKQSRAS